jgi:hypothetical protein
MLRNTLLVLAQTVEPHRRGLRILFALIGIALIAAVVIAPFDQFADLVTDRPGRPFNFSFRSIQQYDFGVVWYPALVVFIGSFVILPALSRRADRRVWMILALILPCAVLSSTLWSLVLLFSDINYPGIPMPEALANLIDDLLPALFVLISIGAMCLAPRIGLPRLALSLAATICLLGWFGVISSIAAIVTDYGTEPKISLVLSALSLVCGACTLTAIDSCVILNEQRHYDVQAISLKEGTINIGAYLSSARNLSVLHLVFLLACVNVSSSYLARVRDLQSARNELALGFALDDLNRRAQSMGDSEASKLVGEWPSTSDSSFSLPISAHALDGIGTMKVSLALYRADQVRVRDIAVAVVGGTNWTVRHSLAGSVAFSGSVQEMLRATAQTVSRPAAGLLRDIAFRWQIDAPAADAADQIYRRVEREFVTREVTLPSVGFGVRSSTAMWWLSFGMLVLSIMIRNQIGLVGKFYPSVQSEPWLVLDVTKGLERIFANLWLWAILLAPWLAGGLLMMTVNAQVIADGGGSSLAPALTRVAGLLAIPLVGGWVAATVVARLMTLRPQHLSLATEATNR